MPTITQDNLEKLLRAQFPDLSAKDVYKRQTVDGIDVREMPQAQLHDLLGYVPQTGELFSGTIDSNLKFVGEDITDVYKRQVVGSSSGLSWIVVLDVALLLLLLLFLMSVAMPKFKVCLLYTSCCRA